MPVLDVANQSLVAVAPGAVAGDPLGPCQLRRWLPGLSLAQVVDRGEEGRLWRTWAVTGEVRWRGTAEVWLQPWHDATIVHLYVRLDPVDIDGVVGVHGVDGHRVQRWRAQLVYGWKDRLGQWRDLRTAGREPGTAALKVLPRVADG